MNEIKYISLNSFMHEVLTHLTMNIESCQINVLHLILVIDKSFAHMLART
jgi:hypothetical protein